MITPWKPGLCVLSLVSLLASPVCTAAAKATLEEAFRSAVERSETVKQSDEQLVQADARVSQLKGGIFPNLAFNVGHAIQQEPSDPVARSFSPQNQTTVNFSLSQPLFRGLREWNGLSQLKYLRAAQEATQEQVLNNLFQDTTANYLQILGYEQDLKNLADQAVLYEKRIGELSGRARRGESGQTDVVSAEATQASLAAEIQLTEGNLQIAREMFAFLTGLPADTELRDPELTKVAPFQPVGKYLERLELRPDIKAAKQRYEASDKNVSVAWGGHFPTLDVGANYYLVRPGFLSDIKWDIGLKLTVPLFEGFATQAKITDAVSKRKEAELDLERARRMARQEISSLHRRLTARLNQLKSLQKSADLSGKNVTLLQRDYRRGLSRNIDVQLALTEARIALRGLDQAHFASQLDLFQLHAASGLAPLKGKATAP